MKYLTGILLLISYPALAATDEMLYSAKAACDKNIIYGLKDQPVTYKSGFETCIKINEQYQQTTRGKFEALRLKLEIEQQKTINESNTKNELEAIKKIR